MENSLYGCAFINCKLPFQPSRKKYCILFYHMNHQQNCQLSISFRFFIVEDDAWSREKISWFAEAKLNLQEWQLEQSWFHLKTEQISNENHLQGTTMQYQQVICTDTIFWQRCCVCACVWVCMCTECWTCHLRRLKGCKWSTDQMLVTFFYLLFCILLFFNCSI